MPSLKFRSDEGSWILPFSLSRLADEIFPSPFTDPVLPLADGRLPVQSDIDRLFGEFSGAEEVVFQWKEYGCLILRDLSMFESWLKRELSGKDESTRWRVLLLDDSGKEGRLVTLAREAGRVAVRSVGRFHSCFIKCLAIRARQEALGKELGSVALVVRAHDRQLGRKVEWHLSRIGRLLEEMDPHAQPGWAAAIGVTRV